MLGCASVLLLGLLALAVYFLAPLRTNILLLGIDYAPGRGTISRSDDNGSDYLIPLKPYVGMLSIPRTCGHGARHR
jgi:hypothetical protein